MRLGVLYISQATKNKQGGLPVRAPLPCRTPIGCPGGIYNSQPAKYTKIPPQTGGYYYFLIEKAPATAFFYKNLYKI
jgi:hypothetical protein